MAVTHSASFHSSRAVFGMQGNPCGLQIIPPLVMGLTCLAHCFRAGWNQQRLCRVKARDTPGDLGDYGTTGLGGPHLFGMRETLGPLGRDFLLGSEGKALHGSSLPPWCV